MAVTKEFLGLAALKPASGTTMVIPVMRAMPRNPLNMAYPALVNKSAYPSQVVMGKRTPGLSIVSLGKNSWLTADFVNDLLFTRDSNGDTKLWDIGVWEPTTGLLRVWHNARAASLALQQGPTGELGVEIMFLATHGNSEGGGAGGGEWANPFSADGTYDSGVWPTGVWLWTSLTADAGVATGIIDVDFAGGGIATLSDVRSWRLNMMVGQGHIHHVDGLRYPSDVASAMFGGTFIIEQAVGAATQVAKEVQGTVVIGINTNKTSGTGRFKITALIYMDETRRDAEVGFGYEMKSYSLIDISAGGNPATCAAY